MVLENRVSHTLMKDLLPLLHPLLHDNSEKVRLAFLELLILVKGMKSLKFWHICSINDLLGKDHHKHVYLYLYMCVCVYYSKTLYNLGRPSNLCILPVWFKFYPVPTSLRFIYSIQPRLDITTNRKNKYEFCNYKILYFTY